MTRNSNLKEYFFFGELLYLRGAFYLYVWAFVTEAWEDPLFLRPCFTAINLL